MSRHDTEAKLHALIAERKLVELMVTTEEFELESCNHNIVPFYSVQLLTYYILDDLDSARFLWKRIPIEIKKADLELQSVWAIGQRLWTHDYAAIYAAFKSPYWLPLHATLVELLEENFRARSFVVIAKSYSIVSSKSLALLLGLSVEDATKFVISKGWENVGDGYFKTKPVALGKTETSNLANMKSLTDYVVYLES